MTGHPFDALFTLAEGFFSWMAAKNHAPSSIETRREALAPFLAWCRDRGLTRAKEISRPILDRYRRHLLNLKKQNGAPLSFKSQGDRLAAVKSFFRWISKNHYLELNPASEMEIPSFGRSTGTLLSSRDLTRILGKPDIGKPSGLRDRAILETLYSAGIRKRELRNLEVGDIDHERGLLTIRQNTGERLAPIGSSALAWLEKYLREARPRYVTSGEEQTLFLTNLGGRFSSSGLARRVGKYLGTGKGACALIRRSVAALMLKNGADILHVRAMIGGGNRAKQTLLREITAERLKKIHARFHPSGRHLKKSRVTAKNKKGDGVTLTGLPETTLGDLIRDFLKEKEIRTAPRTFQFYEWHLRPWRAWFGDKHLSVLDATLVNDFIDHRKKDGAYENTISREIQDLNSVLKFALDRGLLDKILRFKTLPKAENLRPISIVEKEGFEKVMTFINHPYLRLCLRFMRYMGLRKSEALSMRHDWIDTKAGTLSIRSDAHFKTKTKRARVLFIPAPLLAEYLSLPRISAYVHPSSKDPEKPVHSPRKAVLHACEKAAVRHFTLKDLRHSFNTTMAEKGVTSKIRAALLGHTTTAMTDNVYTQAREKTLVEAMKRAMD